MATSAAEDVRENRLHRTAQHQGFAPHKARRGHPRAVDFARYMLVDVRRDVVVAASGRVRPDMDLDAVEPYLSGSTEAA